MINVVFLAQLREQLGTSGMRVHPEAIRSITELKEHLILHHPQWALFLSNPKLLVALNHEYVRGDLPVKSGDEVAFFPPVTGG